LGGVQLLVNTATLPDLESHSAALARCRRCRLGRGIRPITSPAVDPLVMLVGQAPGKVESAGGVAFAGRAGKTLFSWLERAGLDEPTARRKIYIAAVTRCFPGAHPSGRGDRVPSRVEQERCADWLDAELRIIRPPLLIPVGRLAIERFLPKLPLVELIGGVSTVTHVGGESRVIPLPHPSGASSWIHERGNRVLVDRAIGLIADELGRLGLSALN
jgi:uracil-DNA glycosylase